ncbi:MAG: hypothetical protein E7318_12615 [Clostridiales bacterium]|nr:hypothetical protein [Clostridiales bacterium]
MSALFCLGKGRETELYACIEAHLLAFGDVTVKHDRTQTAFVRKVQFAWVSLPRRKADAGAVMLSIGAVSRIDSPRILHAAEVASGRWMHHMLIRHESELDDEVKAWIEAAWALVGPGRKAPVLDP